MIERKENGLAVDTVDQIYWEILDTAAWHMTKGQSEYEATIYSSTAYLVDELRKIRGLMEGRSGAAEDEHDDSIQAEATRKQDQGSQSNTDQTKGEDARAERDRRAQAAISNAILSLIEDEDDPAGPAILEQDLIEYILHGAGRYNKFLDINQVSRIVKVMVLHAMNHNPELEMDYTNARNENQV